MVPNRAKRLIFEQVYIFFMLTLRNSHFYTSIVITKLLNQNLISKSFTSIISSIRKALDLSNWEKLFRNKSQSSMKQF